MYLILYPAVVPDKRLLPVAMGFLVMTQSLGQFIGTLVMPFILEAGWLAAGIFVLVVGLAGTMVLALVKEPSHD